MLLALAGCQGEVAPDRSGEPSEEALRAARGVDQVLAADPVDAIRRHPREGRAERLDHAVRAVEEDLARLQALRDDPSAASRLSTDAWRALVRAVESGRAYLAGLAELRRDLDAPLLGMKQRPGDVGPELAGHLGLEPGQGFLVVEVVPGSLAWQWGIRPWDVVVSFDEVPAPDLDILWMRWEALPEGTEVPLEWLHRGAMQRREIKK